MKETRVVIGKQLRVLRKKQGLTIIDLALMTGVERSYLGKIEAGNINTSIDKLEKILQGLNMTIFEFFDSFHAQENDGAVPRSRS